MISESGKGPSQLVRLWPSRYDATFVFVESSLHKILGVLFLYALH